MDGCDVGAAPGAGSAPRLSGAPQVIDGRNFSVNVAVELEAGECHLSGALLAPPHRPDYFFVSHLMVIKGIPRSVLTNCPIPCTYLSNASANAGGANEVDISAGIACKLTHHGRTSRTHRRICGIITLFVIVVGIV